MQPRPPQPPVELPGTARHGSFTAYQRWGCRCLVCQTFMRSSAKARPASTPRKPLKHGTLYVYNHYGCRCGPCKANRAAYEHARYLRHGSLYAYNTCKCRCIRCRDARRVYDQSRKGTRRGVPPPLRKPRKRSSPWYVCVEDGRRYRRHDYLAGMCHRCDADKATEELWERKWREQ